MKEMYHVLRMKIKYVDTIFICEESYLSLDIISNRETEKPLRLGYTVTIIYSIIIILNTNK